MLMTNSVDGILKSFVKTVDKLNKLIDSKNAEVSKALGSIEELNKTIGVATAERERAAKVVEKLAELIN